MNMKWISFMVWHKDTLKYNLNVNIDLKSENM